MSESPVIWFDDSDPEMHAAYERARATFRYFWCEVAWERRRIVPALNLACVKAAFSDGPDNTDEADRPRVEQMWLEEVDFDGAFVSGNLLNSPNWLKSVAAGDAVRIPLAEITDWILAIDEEAYGAFTVNLLRSRMGLKERKQHDRAWGLQFGDPNALRIVHWSDDPAVGTGDAEVEEHPMSVAMAPSLAEQVRADPSLLADKDDRGWTLLHHQALAGSTATVRVLLEHGADVHARTDHGWTSLRLARSLGWENVAALLMDKGAN